MTATGIPVPATRRARTGRRLRAAPLLTLIPILCLGRCAGEPVREECVAERESGDPAGDRAGSRLWGRTRHEVIRLVDCPGEVTGAGPSGTEGGVSWSGETIAAWDRQETEQGVRLTSPDLGSINTVMTGLRIVLTPGGATRAEIFPHVGRRAQPRMVVPPRQMLNERENRTIRVGLERDADPGDPVTLQVDLTDAVGGNWDDAADMGVLQRLEITLPGARVEEVRLLEAAVQDPGALYAEDAAAARPIEIRGIIRPAWFVNGGARVRIPVRLPDSHTELRWYDGSFGPAGPRVVRIVDADGEVELARSEGRGEWNHRSASLEKWSGKSISIEFSASGNGVGFFGDPRILPAWTGDAPPGVLVYMIDTLRADRIGAWGNPAAVFSPVIDRLAGEGVMFSRAISSSPWTKPAIPTLMTGIWPTTHRVGAVSYSDRLPESVAVVQQRFRDAGWRTGSFSSNPLGSTLSALERGFDTTAPPRAWSGKVGRFGQVSADQLHEALLDWIDEEPDQPMFAYVHTLEVHEYQKRYYNRRQEDGPTGYDAAVQDADRSLGDLLERLRVRDRISSLLVIVVSDHGHSLGEHDMRGHGQSLFQSEIHIPLILWAPGRLAPARIDRPVGLPDVAPTLLDLAGLAGLPEADGRSLLPYVRGEDGPVHDFVAAALLRYVRQPDAPKQFAVVSDDLGKYLRTSDQREFLFDIGTDPNEQRALPISALPLPASLQTWLADQGRAALEFQERHGGSRSQVIDSGDMERLRSLGYLD